MTRLVDLRTEVLDALEVERAVSHPAAGAVVSFIGRVRDHNDGMPVTRLEYEAYPSMAVREMGQIASELEAEFPGVRLAVVHRVGLLEVGDAAIICAASAAHRTEAFDACRKLIDTVKARVPIWKREHGPDGPYWVGWEDARCTPGHHHDHHAGHKHDHHAGHHPQTGASSTTGNPQEQSAPDATLVGHQVLCITISDSRTPQSDASGALAESILSAQGARVERQLVRDESPEIAEAVARGIKTGKSALFLTGGTGIGPRDVTYEAVLPLLHKQLDGFGETFRRLSYDSIGVRAILSRAIAGTIGDVLIFVVPGSPKAVELALRSLVVPLLAHAQSMLQGHGHE